MSACLLQNKEVEYLPVACWSACGNINIFRHWKTEIAGQQSEIFFAAQTAFLKLHYMRMSARRSSSVSSVESEDNLIDTEVLDSERV